MSIPVFIGAAVFFICFGLGLGFIAVKVFKLCYRVGVKFKNLVAWILYKITNRIRIITDWISQTCRKYLPILFTIFILMYLYDSVRMTTMLLNGNRSCLRYWRPILLIKEPYYSDYLCYTDVDLDSGEEMCFVGSTLLS